MNEVIFKKHQVYPRGEKLKNWVSDHEDIMPGSHSLKTKSLIVQDICDICHSKYVTEGMTLGYKVKLESQNIYEGCPEENREKLYLYIHIQPIILKAECPEEIKFEITYPNWSISTQEILEKIQEVIGKYKQKAVRYVAAIKESKKFDGCHITNYEAIIEKGEAPIFRNTFLIDTENVKHFLLIQEFISKLDL